MSARPVLIMAGGTGGHVFPALAVAEALKGDARPVVWMGTRTGLEARVVPEHGIPMEWVTVGGLRGKTIATWLAAPFRVGLAVIQALGIVWRRRPSVVLGMGGFVAGPGGLAAWLLRRPLVIHEQNAAAGLTNRILARLAGTVLEAFPGSFPGRCVDDHVGNPVRRAILDLPAPAERFANRNGALRVLVIGGSQGALALNRIVPQALGRLPDGQRPEIVHQAGSRTLDTARAAYAQAGVEARIEPFIADMADAYAWADLVVCRSGALTVFELAAAGVGSVLVPFPHAVDDHQTRNARYLADSGAALLRAESALTPDSLAADLETLLGDRRQLLTMAEAARALATPRSTDRLVAACLAAAGEAA